MKAGFKEKTIITIIGNRPSDFKLDTEHLIELKRSGVNENIILAMLSSQMGVVLVDEDEWSGESLFKDSKKGDAKVVSTATRVPAAGRWHTLRIMATGSRTYVWIDNEPAGVYEIDAKAGAVLLNAARGNVEVRKLAFAYLPPKIVPANDYKGRTDFALPKLKQSVAPNYSSNPMTARVQGKILYQAVVETDGSVGAVILKSLLHPELEHAGLEAIRQWRFTPAMLAGSPIPTTIEIEMSFTLK